MVHVTDTRGIDSAPNGATPNGPEQDARGGDSESEAMPGIRTGRMGQVEGLTILLSDLEPVPVPVVDMGRLWAERWREVREAEHRQREAARLRDRVAHGGPDYHSATLDFLLAGGAQSTLYSTPYPLPQKPMPKTLSVTEVTNLVAAVMCTMRYRAMRGHLDKQCPARVVEDIAHALAVELDGTFPDEFNPQEFLETVGY